MKTLKLIVISAIMAIGLLSCYKEVTCGTYTYDTEKNSATNYKDDF